MNKNCVLVGGSGFIGLNLAKALIQAGYHVTIVDIRFPVIPGFKYTAKNINFCKVDYRDAKKIKGVLKNQDVLFHLACSSLPGTPIAKVENDIRDNVIESVRFFKNVVESGIRLIIFPSSGGTAYGNQEKLPIKETFLTNPICSYGVTKLMIEKYLFFFNKMFGVDYLIFRIGNLYGPGQMPNATQGVIANVIDKLLQDKPITIFGRGDNIRDYIYVEDAVKALVIGLKKGLKNDVFNISTGKGHSINDVIRVIAKVTEIKPRIVHSCKRPFDVAANVLDSHKFFLATGWKPETSIEEGIKNAYEWIKGSLA